MKIVRENADVGIIVGRFMVHELHAGHIELIESVQKNHDKVIIFLGLSPLRNTINNPLDYRCRRQMINEQFPEIEIHYIEDCPDDHVWSKNLDSQIEKWISPHQTVILYGGRNSFIECYFGKYKTCLLESNSFVSGTEIRRKVSNFYNPSKDYRAGMIAASLNRFPTSYQTVDIAILNEDKTKLLLARKPNEKQWRFVGGFASPDSSSLEEDARREVVEEASIEIGDIKYVGSVKINDWRYKNEKDIIKTAFFVAKYTYGRPEGGDDVAEVKWFDINVNDYDEFFSLPIMSCHVILLNMLKDYLKKEGEKNHE